MVNMNSTVNEVIDELRFMTNKLAAKIDLQDMHPPIAILSLLSRYG